MSRSKPLSDELLARAAELRAGGAKWDAVAKALNRAPDTVSAWPRKHPERWRAALKEAERRTLGEASAESVLVLRTLLRSTDEKVARDAAKSLTDLRLDSTKLDLAAEGDAPPAAFTSDTARIAAFLDGHSDDELARLAAALFPLAGAYQSVQDEPGADRGAA